jgi:PAS domain S-box-containing protein
MAVMETIRLAIAMSAGAVCIIGLLYLLMHWRLVAAGIPTKPTHLFFSGICFSAVAYNTVSIGLYGATTLPAAYQWQRAQVLALSATLLLTMFFVSSLVTWRSRIVERFFSLYFPVLAALLFILPPGPLTWPLEPAPKVVRLGSSFVAVYPEVANGVIPLVNFLVELLLGAYIFTLVIRFSRKGNRHAAGPMLAGLSCCAVAALNDLAVTTGRYPFFYLIEFSLLPVVVGMTAALINRHTRTIGLTAEKEHALAAREYAIDHSISAFAMADLGGRLIYANQAFLTLWGFSSMGEAMGSTSAWAWADEGTEARILKELMDAGLWSGDLMGRRKDGALIAVQVNVNTVAGEDGKPFCMVAWFQDVSRRKHEEEELRRMALLLDMTPNSITVHEVDGSRFLYANQRTAEMHGWTREEFLALDLARVDTPMGYAKLAEIRRVIADRGEITFEGEHQRKDGSSFPVEVHARVTELGGRQVILSIATDITRRKAAETALRESELRLRHLADNLPHAMVYQITAPPGGGRRFTYVSRGVERLNEVTAEEVLADANVIYRQFLPDSLKEVRELEEEALRNESPLRVEVECLLPSGRRRWFEFASTSRRLADGMLVWDGVEVDITERKLAEAALRESEEQFRQLAENINRVFWILTPDWSKVIYISPAFESVWGRTTEELYRDPGIWYEPIILEDRPALDAEIARKVAGDFSDPNFSEYRIMRPDGSVAWIQARVFPVRDGEGRIVRVAGLAADVTGDVEARRNLQRAKEMIEQQYDELRQLDTIKDGLLRDVTHELQTPVAKQAMYLELLRRAVRDDDRGRFDPIMKVLESSVRRQQEVIRNMLDLSRLEAGGRRFDIGPVDLAGLVGRVAEEYRAFMEQVSVGLELDLDDAPSALGDGEMLVHVVSNLLNNAIKFRKPGRPGMVRIATRTVGDAALLRIADDGIGIDTGALPRVFDRFFQATASSEGSGVGLAICKVLVEGMGGSISLDSPGPGKGCVAEIRLPTVRRSRSS